MNKIAYVAKLAETENIPRTRFTQKCTSGLRKEVLGLQEEMFIWKQRIPKPWNNILYQITFLRARSHLMTTKNRLHGYQCDCSHLSMTTKLCFVIVINVIY